MTTHEKPSAKTSSGSSSPEPPKAKDEEKPAVPKAFEKPPEAFERTPRAFGKSEAAPKLETPERKHEAPPEEAPRDEESELETPEEPREAVPSVPPVAEVKVAAVAVPTFGVKPPKPVAPTSLPTDVAALFDHVASNPVDSHAPVWTVHTPNTKGGYS